MHPALEVLAVERGQGGCRSWRSSPAGPGGYRPDGGRPQAGAAGRARRRSHGAPEPLRPRRGRGGSIGASALASLARDHADSPKSMPPRRAGLAVARTQAGTGGRRCAADGAGAVDDRSRTRRAPISIAAEHQRGGSPGRLEDERRSDDQVESSPGAEAPAAHLARRRGRRRGNARPQRHADPRPRGRPRPRPSSGAERRARTLPGRRLMAFLGGPRCVDGAAVAPCNGRARGPTP